MTTAIDEMEQAVADAAHVGKPEFEPEEARAFARALEALNNTDLPYVLGGAFAKHAYTGVWRDTKDLDIFLKASDLKAALDALAKTGFQTEVEIQHWLAKAKQDPYFVDLIFGMGNGLLPVDDEWLAHNRPYVVAGVKTRLIQIEDLIVSKVYVMERYRCDVADVLHLIRCARGKLNWPYIRSRLGDHWELLLVYLMMFDYVYPGHATYLPQQFMSELFQEAQKRWAQPQPPKAFRGTLLDPFSFLVDIEDWGYADLRKLEPLVNEKGELR